MNYIEKNLKAICHSKGLSLTDVANRIGSSPSNLLSSVKGNPTISKIQDIASALNISVSELLTMRPETTEGIVIIGGQTFQLSKPAASTVQLPVFDRYDTLREEVKVFVKKAIEGAETVSKMGLLETMEVFSLIYDPHAAKFFLSLCYADGKTHTITYDKLEYCDWKDGDTEETVKWNLANITTDIINDIEGFVPSKLMAE